MQRLIGRADTEHCIKKIGGKLDELFHLDLLGYEALAFYIYSNASNWHADINRALWAGASDPDVLTFAQVLDEALLKLPALKGEAGTVYRGLNVSDIEAFSQAYVEGSEIVFPAFTSAAYKESAAFGGNVLFIIRANSARSVWYLAAHFHEEEALLPTGCRFRVVSTAQRGQRMVIVLQELGSR
ncbi:ADP-ribosyltransferase domain-containing protein [Enterovirga aerilata]|uniref:NAD(+)--protein-arginine ADP-ribosyltransferase n=1 Tax=Enterovirga aerilata TaxID=2730920 RepID=A0A849I789_9HYPH|nr:hypothetical protein [Enterovirga sp. DB1703]